MSVKMLRAGVATIVLIGMTSQALAGSCSNREGRQALRVAALQQELMVAALTCHAIPRYNEFVHSYQGELQASDDSLKAYFTHTSSVAEYHAFKTRLANQDSMRSIRDSDYCFEADAAFQASQGAGSLGALVAHTPVMLDDADADCAGSDDAAIRGSGNAGNERVATSGRDSSGDGDYSAPRQHVFVPDAPGH